MDTNSNLIKRPRTISTNDLDPNKLFYVRGHLAFSRLASQIKGKELEKDNERAAAHNQKTHEKPYTKAEIVDAQVLYGDPNASRDVHNSAFKTKEEIFAEEHLFTRKATGDNVVYFAAENNSQYELPWICVASVDENGQPVYNQIVLEQNLAVGLDVTLVIKAFKTSANKRNGTNLVGVIVNEPVRYYTQTDTLGLLAQSGAIVNRCEVPPLYTDDESVEETEPTPTPVAPPTGYPFSNAMPTPPTAVPAQSVPSPMTMAVPMQPNSMPNPAQSTVPPMNVPNAQPAAPTAQQGIRYDPNARAY